VNLSEAHKIAIKEAANLEIPWKKRVSYVKRRVRELYCERNS